MRSKRTALLAGALLLWLQGAGWALESEAQHDTATGPIILSPEEGAEVPRDGIDPPCPPQGPCPKVIFKGRVPEGLWPFIGVAPLSMSPKIWIQPDVQFVKKDGTFESLIFVGSERHGAGERFHLFLFACAGKGHFSRGQTISILPEDCQVSDPVSVLRTR
jgi:hypothetical protein